MRISLKLNQRKRKIMIKTKYRVILLSILFIFIAVITAEAATPIPSEVSDDIIEPQKTELSARREALNIRRDSIKLNVAIHNTKCTKVKPGSSIVAECRANMGKLRDEISGYAADVNAFNKEVLDAPRVLDQPQDVPVLSNHMIKYFLINRDENYDIHRAIMAEMIDDATGSGKKWPGPKSPHPRLTNPLDESQELWDKELLKPLDLEKLKHLSPEQAAQVVNKRADAREREATRKASNRMHKEMRKLEKKWGLKTGYNLTAMEKNNPEFKKELDDILNKITKDEIAETRWAHSFTLTEYGQIMDAREIDPAKKLMFNKTKQEIYNRRDEAINRANSQSLKDMAHEMERLKYEGYYRDGDNLVEMDKNDPQFREAVNEAVRNVLIRQYEAEQWAQQKSLNEMQSAIKELLDK